MASAPNRAVAAFPSATRPDSYKGNSQKGGRERGFRPKFALLLPAETLVPGHRSLNYSDQVRKLVSDNYLRNQIAPSEQTLLKHPDIV